MISTCCITCANERYCKDKCTGTECDTCKGHPSCWVNRNKKDVPKSDNADR